MTPDERVARARRAQQLLSDPLLVEAFAVIEEECIGAFRGSEPGDSAGRERAYLRLGLLDEIKEQLAAIARDEQVVDHETELNRINT